MTWLQISLLVLAWSMSVVGLLVGLVHDAWGFSIILNGLAVIVFMIFRSTLPDRHQ